MNSCFFTFVDLTKPSVQHKYLLQIIAHIKKCYQSNDFYFIHLNFRYDTVVYRHLFLIILSFIQKISINNFTIESGKQHNKI